MAAGAGRHIDGGDHRFGGKRITRISGRNAGT
jgi:hypothetical protein